MKHVLHKLHQDIHKANLLIFNKLGTLSTLCGNLLPKKHKKTSNFVM